MVLDLPPELEQRLNREALRLGVSMEECASRILDQFLPPCDDPERRARAIAMLQTWLKESDEHEDQEAGKLLRDAVDEDRMPGSKLFPPEMKDLTW